MCIGKGVVTMTGHETQSVQEPQVKIQKRREMKDTKKEIKLKSLKVLARRNICYSQVLQEVTWKD